MRGGRLGEEVKAGCVHSIKAMLVCEMGTPNGGIAFAPLKPCWVAEILLRISDYIECVIHALACALEPLLAALAKSFRPAPEMPEPSLPVVGWALAEGVGFEPTIPCGMPVFKTGAFDHSATPP